MAYGNAINGIEASMGAMVPGYGSSGAAYARALQAPAEIAPSMFTGGHTRTTNVYQPNLAGTVMLPPKQKMGFFEGMGKFLGNTAKGVVQPLVDIVTDPKKLLMAGAMVGVCLIPGVNVVAIPALTALGALHTGKTALDFGGEFFGGLADGDWQRVTDSGQLLGNAAFSGVGTWLGARANMESVNTIYQAKGLGAIPENAIWANIKMLGSPGKLLSAAKGKFMVGDEAAVFVKAVDGVDDTGKWYVPVKKLGADGTEFIDYKNFNDAVGHYKNALNNNPNPGWFAKSRNWVGNQVKKPGEWWSNWRNSGGTSSTTTASGAASTPTSASVPTLTSSTDKVQMLNQLKGNAWKLDLENGSLVPKYQDNGTWTVVGNNKDALARNFGGFEQWNRSPSQFMADQANRVRSYNTKPAAANNGQAASTSTTNADKPGFWGRLWNKDGSDAFTSDDFQWANVTLGPLGEPVKTLGLTTAAFGGNALEQQARAQSLMQEMYPGLAQTMQPGYHPGGAESYGGYGGYGGYTAGMETADPFNYNYNQQGGNNPFQMGTGQFAHYYG